MNGYSTLRMDDPDRRSRMELAMGTGTESQADLLTPGQAANYLRVSRDTIYRYIRRGKLGAARCGRGYRISKRSLDGLLWSTRSRPDVALRDYSREQIDAFLRDDELTGDAREDAERFRQGVETTTNGQATERRQHVSRA